MSLEIISIIFIGIGVLSAIYIAIDLRKHPQHMKIMYIVWTINGLYLGPYGIWTYKKMNKGHSNHRHKDNHDHEHHDPKQKGISFNSVFKSTSHCSSGCVLGDVIGAPLVYLTGFTIFGYTLFADYLVEFILAYLFGIGFQMLAILPMSKDMSLKEGFINAIKADTLSLIAFEIGMFGWMALVHFYLFDTPPTPNTFTFWFMMQIAMILGAMTSFPANYLLVKIGIKHAM